MIQREGQNKLSLLVSTSSLLTLSVGGCVFDTRQLHIQEQLWLTNGKFEVLARSQNYLKGVQEHYIGVLNIHENVTHAARWRI